MKNRKRQQSDDEIEADVLNKLNDPAAWEVLPPVPPSHAPRPDWVVALERMDSKHEPYEAVRKRLIKAGKLRG
jgi:hypothetical protein